MLLEKTLQKISFLNVKNIYMNIKLSKIIHDTHIQSFAI